MDDNNFNLNNSDPSGFDNKNGFSSAEDFTSKNSYADPYNSSFGNNPGSSNQYGSGAYNPNTNYTSYNSYGSSDPGYYGQQNGYNSMNSPYGTQGGYQPYPGNPYSPYANPNAYPKQNNGDIGGLVCGIISIFIGSIVGLILGIVGAVMSSNAKKRTAMINGVPSSNSKAGFICSIIGIIWSAISILFLILAIVIAANTEPKKTKTSSNDIYNDYDYFDDYETNFQTSASITLDDFIR